MFANSLTREVSLMVGPVILEVLVKHYFDRLKNDVDRSESGASLKQDDVLYHEAFTIVKSFLNASTFHTIEELQAFSNTRTPSPPWTHVVRTLVPLSCCEEAAPYLIKALGGEEVARRLVGGVKWWQVRGVNGVDAQWLTARKDWEDAKRRHKKQQEQRTNGLSTPPSTDDLKDKSEGVYEKNMDAMRCILYIHGGGYYFGSVDQERYSIQRFARKINGRVFAINYRLAPQYPFPCGLHDVVAAYLYLIRPPPDAAHQAVNPAHIIIAGDSAGGGLSLALLQVIRDSGLPAPAGGFLISPWCDLTHSFPSLHINTDTDVIPESGLSFHKPSLLWPPPSQEVSSRVHASLRFRIRQAFKPDEPSRQTQESTMSELQGNIPADLNTPITPTPPVDPEKILVNAKSGEVIEVNQQLHFYTRNSLLAHPLVSPAMSYLGGLPPLLFIAGDKEVLRDEIVYSAHKAAYPEKYPVSDVARQLYPSLNGIEKRCKPTSVHLQVYDDSPHILPILFSFATPAKFCFRGIASFCKLVTEMTPIPVPSDPPTSPTSPIIKSPAISRRQTLLATFKASRFVQSPTSPVEMAFTDAPQVMEPEPTDTLQDRPSLRRSLSARFSRTASVVIRRSTSFSPPTPIEEAHITQPEATVSDPAITTNHKDASTSSDVGGPRFKASPPSQKEFAERTAGDISVYSDIEDVTSWDCRMIRERVDTRGVTRQLEPEQEIAALQVPIEHIGNFSEPTMRRYLRDRAIFEKRFAHTVKTIEKTRRHNLERAKEDTIKRLGRLRQSLTRDGKAAVNGHNKKEVKENVLSSPGWGWAWALDEAEEPPPSSIVSRRDTEEARKLAEVADLAVLSEDQAFSANNLWSVVINFLTVTPGKPSHTLHKDPPESSDNLPGDGGPSMNGLTPKHKSRISRLHMFKRHAAKDGEA
ncbi:hypothetical protein GALMADRAFT_248228 [Galerina marginata CBS 339.88]|uniref:Alpha/beta hydrolase fold-3 domain-containing protein n=1 Tax=Galerina marginata (strain CBS 339.88) TaxID=685588 RepID=A0A067T9F6_GALM3|nr:hypothetical protein GALMADRAFT_248228 [Galerina marginata CBS 339.88]